VPEADDAVIAMKARKPRTATRRPPRLSLDDLR
jgi:hypothetical protein